MIKNERQYLMTKTRLGQFQAALKMLGDASATSDPLILEIEKAAFESQIEVLETEVLEYEQLKSGEVSFFDLASIGDISKVLIGARIASGLTQRELAERLGVKPQQLQRWEAQDYSGVSLETLSEVAESLGVSIANKVFIGNAKKQKEAFKENLKIMGLDSVFIKRILPSHLWFEFHGGQGARGVLNTAGIISKIFGIAPEALLVGSPTLKFFSASSQARFKLPKRASSKVVAATAVYANYLASVVISALKVEPASLPEKSWEAFRSDVIEQFGSVSFISVYRFVWGLGVPVIPLDIAGGFHGAVWRIDGKNVIVLKKNSKFSSRWLFDLLHEFRHTMEEPGEEEFSIIEAEPIAESRRRSANEDAADEFAEDVLMAGLSQEIEDEVVSLAKSSVERLKAVIPQVAERRSIDVGVLANHFAFRLSEEGNPGWWGTCHNLQPEGSEHDWDQACNIFWHYIDQRKLNAADLELLVEALRT